VARNGDLFADRPVDPAPHTGGDRAARAGEYNRFASRAGEGGRIIGPDDRTLGQWNAWCAAAATVEERRARIDSAPAELVEQIKGHLRTLWALRKKAAARVSAPKRAASSAIEGG